MRSRGVTLAALVCFVLVAAPGNAQGIKDRLKKMGVTVTTTKDTAKGKAGDASPSGANRAAVALPASSGAHPDVMGLKLGQSTVADARAMLSASKPGFDFGDESASLSAKAKFGGMAGDTTVVVANSKAVRHIFAISSAYNEGHVRPSDVRTCGGRPDAKKGTCESVEFTFAPAPSAPVLLAVERTIQFAPMPTADAIEKAYNERYGEPGYRNVVGETRHLTWAWGADGKPVKVTEGCKEFVNGHAAWGAGDRAEIVARAGCMAVVKVAFTASNTVVSQMSFEAFDAFGIATTAAKAVEFTEQYVAALQKKQRDEAAQVKIP